MAAGGSDPVFPDLVDSSFDVVGDSVDSLISGNEALGHHSVTTASPTASVPLSASTAVSTAHPAFVPDPNWNLQFQGPSPTEPLPFGDLFAPQYAPAPSWPGPAAQYVGELPQRSRPQQLSADINPSSLSLDTNVSPGIGHIRPNFSDKVLNTLTPAQQETLRNIAMPPHLVYQSPKSEPSPPSSMGEHQKDTPSSPDAVDPTKAKNRKRKASADEEDDDDDDEDGPQPVKKTAHNMIEKRYRTNLNDKIAALRDSVPSLRIMSKSARGEDTTEDREELHGLTPAHKLNKATVLSKATEYIRHLEKRNNRLTGENSLMQERLSAFEALYRNALLRQTIPMSPMQQPPTPMPYPPDGGPFLSTPLPTPGGGGGGGDARGMIPVTDGMKRILDAQAAAGQPYPIPQQPFPPGSAALMRQQQIQSQQQQQQQQQAQWPNGGPYGRAMLGALAALMIIEVAREHEQSNETPQGRGLFAVPLHLLGSLLPGPQFTVAGYHFATAQIITTTKLLLLLGTLLWVFVPSLFIQSPPKPQKSRQDNATLEAVPSLASPIHVRRQAWLTAVQTVWVPRHNFFLEAAALVLKTMKLSLRNTIGVHGYQMLTGLTEEQETARVKAWTIALDAQLAGGDIEINGSRLSLTLLASWTLPNTPSRLMLKALHIRVMLRQCGKNALFNLISAQWARVHWNAARQLRDVTAQLRRDDGQATDDDLPEHLALLLDQSCEEVLNDDIVQRAHNLAWNKPTVHNVTEDIEGMNAVVEDPAVRSPMDAVAAWWSSLVLQRTLMSSLGQEAEAPDSAAPAAQLSQQQEELDLAAKVAPIGSSAQIRALVARAVLVSEKRGSSIATALSALSHTINPDKHPQYSRGVPPLIDSPMSSITPDPDVQMALRCAMGIAHLQRFAAPPQEALSIINSIIPGAASGVSLLACTATFKLMNCLYAHGVAAEACSIALERLAGTLRIWVGSASGDDCGLDQDVRHKIVNRCLAITKSMVGFESDTGYWSMSDGGGDD